MSGAIHKLRRLLIWVGSHGNVALVVALLAVGGVWAFVELADEVIEGDTQQWDEWAVNAFRNPDDSVVGPRWVQEIVRDMTALGGIFVLCLVTAAVAGYLLMVRKYHAMWLVLAATAGGLILSLVLKNSFGRERPHVETKLSEVYTSSFPSGHSMMAAVVYLTLGSLLMRLVPRRVVKVYFLGVAILLSALVGFSRVYVGAHYPSDVLAGWTAGLVWALVCWLVARALQRRGAVEKDRDETDAVNEQEEKVVEKMAEPAGLDVKV